MAGVPWTSRDVAILRAMAPRCSSFEIAAELGRTSDAVKHAARRHGIELRKCGEAVPNARYSDDLIEKARQLHDQGYGPRWISRRLQINEWTLRSALYYRQRQRPAGSLLQRARSRADRAERVAASQATAK